MEDAIDCWNHSVCAFASTGSFQSSNLARLLLYQYTERRTTIYNHREGITPGTQSWAFSMTRPPRDRRSTPCAIARCRWRMSRSARALPRAARRLPTTPTCRQGEGAAVGAVWGGLVGLAALLIPWRRPLYCPGQRWGAAITGAVTGAVVGGISAALIDFGGIPEAEAHRYESLVHEGKTPVAVKARDEDTSEVHRILNSFGATPADTTGVRAPSNVSDVRRAGQARVSGY